ncbi:NUDIX domain-containing protein [Actinotalea sp. M2MS4P-6]|uniref:NUDIX hydrolase n=1 Tax=Actinotalea sp. M2MS4P-6 TaxID=2983762 RepID=UPI0021E4A9BB|nr:NUDIX domain-containing protein [Actinotalea sp. M2MS4P-6]MCV2392868.1 NUDIX domain-containing protein [Actinotalea sp. M2MS4P-6]
MGAHDEVAGRDPRSNGQEPYHDPERRTRVAAYALARRDGAILLARASAASDQPRTWWLPGGGIDFGEQPDAAAVRETLEETGIQVRVHGEPEVHTEVSTSRDGTQVHHVRLVFRCDVVGGELAAEVGGSTDCAAWVSAERVLALPLAGFVRRVIERSQILGE